MEFLSPGASFSIIRKNPVTLSNSNSVSVAVFQGVTRKGPVATLTKVRSMSDFYAEFGDASDTGYLVESLEGFFMNGGSEAYVSRSAHFTTISTFSSYDMVVATKTLQDGSSVNTLRADMSSPGVWGNSYRGTTLRKSTYLTTVATNIPGTPVTTADLTSASQVSIGDLLELKNGVNTAIVTVTSKSGNTIGFSSVTATGAINASGSEVNLLTFKLTIVDGNGDVVQTYDNLRMSSLSSRYCVDIVNKTYRTPIILTNLSAATPDSRPANSTNFQFASGSDGSTVVAADYVGDSGAKNGIYAMDAKSDFGMCSIPGITTGSVAQALIDYAESRKLFMALLDLPLSTAVSAVGTYVNTTVNRSSMFAAYVYPWLKTTSNLTGAEISVPAAGFVSGIIARVDRDRGVYKAPAGVPDGLVRNISGLVTEVSKSDYDTIYPLKVNAIQPQPEGPAFMGNVTLDPTGEFASLNVVRFFLYVLVQVKAALRFVNFEPNNATTRLRVTRSIEAILYQMWRNGWLNGDTPDQAYYVICNSTNNSLLSPRKLSVRIGIYPVNAVEGLETTLEQDTRAIDAALAA